MKNFNETWTISPTVSGRGEFHKYKVKDLLIFTPFKHPSGWVRNNMKEKKQLLLVEAVPNFILFCRS